MATVLISASRDLPHLGWDPTPGDPDAVAINAAYLRSLAANLRELASHLDVSHRPRAWRGRAADAFCAAATALPRDTDTAGRSFEEVGQTLATWAETLRDLQAEAGSLDRQIGDATTRLARWTAAAAPVLAELGDQLASWSPANPVTGGGYGWTTAPVVNPTLMDLPGYQTDPAITAMNTAAQEVEHLQHQAQDLHRRYLDHATRLARRIDAASAPAPATPHFRLQIGDWFSEQWDAWDDSGGQRLRTYAPAIDRMTDTSGAIGVTAGVLAFIPPLTVISGSIALLSGFISLGGNTLLATTSGGSWKDAGLDASGLFIGSAASKLTQRIIKSYETTGRAGELIRVPTILGGETRVPPGLFSSRTMEGSEGVLRVARLKVTQAGISISGIQSRSLANEYVAKPSSQDPWDRPGFTGTAYLEIEPKDNS
jgi:hypothetical protein